MTDKDRLKIVWAAINVMIEEIYIMKAIEAVVGKKEIDDQWEKYIDDPRGTERAIRTDLRAMRKKK